MQLFKQLFAFIFTLFMTFANAGEDDQLVIGTQVRRILKDAGHRTASNFVEELNIVVHELIDAAIRRAEANGRRTVQAYDL
jgi:histone H3/H4